jgi:hypothetical protein
VKYVQEQYVQELFVQEQFVRFDLLKGPFVVQMVGCCCGEEVFCGSGAMCWGLSEMSSLEATSEAFSEFASGNSPSQ